MADVVTPQPDMPTVPGRQADSPGNSFLGAGRARVAAPDELAAGHQLAAPRVPGIADSATGGPIVHVDYQAASLTAPRSVTTWTPRAGDHPESATYQGQRGMPPAVTVDFLDYRGPSGAGDLPLPADPFAGQSRADHELTPTPVRPAGVSDPGGPVAGMGEDVQP